MLGGIVGSVKLADQWALGMIAPTRRKMDFSPTFANHTNNREISKTTKKGTHWDDDTPEFY